MSKSPPLKPSFKEITEKNELISLIRKVAKLSGEKDEKFLEEYIDEVLKKDRTKALICFRDIVEQMKYANCIIKINKDIKKDEWMSYTRKK